VVPNEPQGEAQFFPSYSPAELESSDQSLA
jgi:hypothetical protein